MDIRFRCDRWLEQPGIIESTTWESIGYNIAGKIIIIALNFSLNMFEILKPALRILTVLTTLFVQVASADVLTDILEKGPMRVGVALFVPHTMQDKSGSLSGFEIEVAKKSRR